MALAWAASEDRFTVVVGGTTDPLSDADRRQIEADLADLATNIYSSVRVQRVSRKSTRVIARQTPLRPAGGQRVDAG